jgi:hypothetical protein
MKLITLLIIALSAFLVACDGEGLPGAAVEQSTIVETVQVDAGKSVCQNDGTNCPAKVPFCPPEGCAICQNDGTGCAARAVAHCQIMAPPSGIASPGVYAPPAGMDCASIKSILQDGTPMDIGTFSIQCGSSTGSSFISVTPHSGNPTEMVFKACE